MSKLIEIIVMTLVLGQVLIAQLRLDFSPPEGRTRSPIDVEYIIEQANGVLETISIPTKNNIIVKVTPGGRSYAYPCSGEMNWGWVVESGSREFDRTNATGLIHEFIHARFNPCTMGDDVNGLLEGMTEAKLRWVLLELEKKGIRTIRSVSMMYDVGLNSAKWLVAGGGINFYRNPSSSYDCVAGPWERIASANNGDFRGIDRELARLYAERGNLTRSDILEALDLGSNKVNGKLPSTLIGEVKCDFGIMPGTPLQVETDRIIMAVNDSGSSLPTDLFGTSLVGLRFFDQQVYQRTGGFNERVRGLPFRVSITDSGGQKIHNAIYTEPSVVYRPGGSLIEVPSGAYLRRYCLIREDGSYDDDLCNTRFLVVTKGQDWAKGKLLLVANGPNYHELSNRVNLQLAGDSVDKHFVETAPGLFVVHCNTGTVSITDGTTTRTFTCSPLSSIVEYWKQFDDVLLLRATASKGGMTFEASVGEQLHLVLKGATHNDPVAYSAPYPDEGCVGDGYATRVVFTTSDGSRTYAPLAYCSQELITLTVPNLPPGEIVMSVELVAPAGVVTASKPVGMKVR